MDGRRRVRVRHWGDVREETPPSPLRLDVLLSTQELLSRMLDIIEKTEEQR